MIITAQGPYDLANHKAPVRVPGEAVAAGDNNPPTPYDAILAHIEDLEAEALLHLDGQPIATEAQAAAVSKLMDEAREARAAAEEQRKAEAKPFDDGKAAVQTLWKPLADEKTGRCALIAKTCSDALSPWLQRLDDEQRAVAEAARSEAEEKAAAARTLLAATDPANLADRKAAEAALADAGAAEKAAVRADKARPRAGGGDGRATGLRARWLGEITDPVAFGRWAWEHRRGEYLTFLETLAAREARGGPKPIPGLNIISDRKAV